MKDYPSNIPQYSQTLSIPVPLIVIIKEYNFLP